MKFNFSVIIFEVYLHIELLQCVFVFPHYTRWNNIVPFRITFEISIIDSEERLISKIFQNLNTFTKIVKPIPLFDSSS